MQVSATQKIRGADGKVIGFGVNGKARPMFDGGATRKRRLSILSRALGLFVFDEIPNSGRTNDELAAVAKIHEAMMILDKAGDHLDAVDKQRGKRS